MSIATLRTARVARALGFVATTTVAAVVTAGATPAASVASTESGALGTATVAPARFLTSGQQVTVAVTGFPADAVVGGVQCDQRVLTTGDQGYCDVENFVVIMTDASGAGSGTFTVHSGQEFASVNDEGVCDAQQPCTLALSTQGHPDATTAIAPIEFGTRTMTSAGPARRTVRAGAPLRLSIEVDAPSGSPSGSVAIKKGDTVLATRRLPASGRLSFARRLPVGVHRLSVQYSGDRAFLASRDLVVARVMRRG